MHFNNLFINKNNKQRFMVSIGFVCYLLFTLLTPYTAQAQAVKPSAKVWFVTGANRGIGEAITKAALAKGDKVVATARNPQSAKKTLGNSTNLLVVQVDVTNTEQIKKAVQDAIQKFGRIDVLVNNAGYGQLGFFEETSSEAIRRQFDVNVFGAMDVTREILPHMRNKKSGFVISMSSIGGVVAGMGCSTYCGSKFALEGWMEGLSHEIAPFGIHAMIIEPGAFRTDFLDSSSVNYGNGSIADYSERAQSYKANYDRANHKQAGDPVKLANAIVTLVNSQNPPLRFLAGNDAVEGTEKRLLEARQKELNTWRELSTSLSFDNP